MVAANRLVNCRLFKDIGPTFANESYNIDISTTISRYGGTIMTGFARGRVYGNNNFCLGNVVISDTNILTYSADKANDIITVIEGVIFYE